MKKELFEEILKDLSKINIPFELPLKRSSEKLKMLLILKEMGKISEETFKESTKPLNKTQLAFSKLLELYISERIKNAN